MGFEVTYRYHERLEEGGYDKAETKELKRKVGDPFEDVQLEKLASLIMGQLARRDIWVTDVEIYELKKQKVSFRETKGGIIVKNKKFILDAENNNITCQDIQEVPVVPPQQQMALVPQNGVVAPHNALALNQQQASGPKRPIKFVVVDDTGAIQDGNGDRVPVIMAIKRAGLQFRPGQRYPVYQELDDPRDKRVDKFGHPTLDRKKVYMMWDDAKRDVMVSQDYFVPADIRLERSIADDPWDVGGKTAGGTGGPKLMFESEDESAGMPDLRGRK